MVLAVGISNLQFVDLNSPRNLFIVGFSFYVGISIPDYIQANPEAINTGIIYWRRCSIYKEGEGAKTVVIANHAFFLT